MNPEETPGYRVVVLIDGVECPLKPFLHEMLGGAVMGLVSGLRGVDDPSRVELRVDRTQDGSSD